MIYVFVFCVYSGMIHCIDALRTHSIHRMINKYMSASFDCNAKGTLSDYNIQKLDTVQMLGRLRGGAEAADDAMDVDIDISTISDEDILAEFMRRDLLATVLPKIPDASSPQVLHEIIINRQFNKQFKSLMAAETESS